MSQPLASDPATAALPQAALWIGQTMTGSLSTIIAMLAVASIGFLMLSGRINLRHAASVVIGCFLVFGAPVLAVALHGLAAGQFASVPPVIAPEVSPLAVQPPPPPSSPYDPYAGASVPKNE